MKFKKGFTLLEVMIALTIFALIATTLSQTTSVSVDNQIYLEQKLLANWIAENEIIRLRTEPFANIKNAKTEIEYSDREWLINTVVANKCIESPIPLDLKRVEVQILSNQSESNSPIISLVTCMANDDI